ncbi:hypothetical protein MJO55_06085 [Mycolicibacterium rufum]|uniref:Phage protein D n=1 Tax=Mycolicibacterium rufum TaxID=318424 RepID=A0A9X2YA49_9MYCO|nr:hypothetical protein [Mycolicibacterium rufum]KGI67128.1 hypothetical protein EU78_06260 [Mycolicibacterium rufum]MCV7070117.1 hypothetical protein [Mycolicibacterium rufum]ULP37995.1 hypothetical protein MJO55_06085 [Mycolicibacterium rufum]
MAKSLQLMVMIGPVLAVPVPAALIDALQSVQVTTSAGQRSGFQLSFAVSKQSMISTTLLPSGLLDPPARVIISAVLGGFPTVLIDGIVTRHEVSPSDTPGESSLTVTGEDLTALMDMSHERMCYPAMPLNLRVMAIVAKYALYGIIPAAVPAVIFNVPNPLKTIPVQSGTDLNYIQALASEAGYSFFLIPGPAPGVSVAYWGPEARAGMMQPALTVNSGAATNVESLSFSFDGLSRTQYTITLTEPNTKIGIPIPVPDVSLLRPPLAARPAVALRREPLPDVAGRDPLDIALRGLSKTTQAADAVTGQGKLDVLRYGHVLEARSIVGVRGAGLNYDGTYYVKSVTHNIKRGEYKQSFTLARDGFLPLAPAVLP